MYTKKDKQVKYGISDLKYDIKTNLIKIQDKEDNMVKVTTITTTTTTTNPNIEESSSSSDDETPIVQPTILTPNIGSTSLRSASNAPSHNKNTRTTPSNETPNPPPRPKKTCTKSTPTKTARFSRIAKELIGLTLESDDYIKYKENNQPGKIIERAYYSLGFGDEPLSRAEAMQRADWPQWSQAEEIEVDALFKRGTFVYVKKENVPKDKKIIKCKWVYKRKPDRYKARLVVKGFMQSPFDYGETYAPVCKLSTIRTMLSLLPSKRNWGSRQIDIGNAFIEAYLPPGEEVYMENIPGYEKPGYVVKLIRALYGLKQSPKHWADLLADTLKNLGYKQYYLTMIHVCIGISILKLKEKYILLVMLMIYWSFETNNI